MANLRQDRVPDPTLGSPSAAAGEAAVTNGRTAPPRGIVLSVLLRAKDSAGAPAVVSWRSEAASAALAIDVITASGGTPEQAQGAVLSAGFFNLQSAVLAARRLAWALEGLAESSGSTAAATFTIHAVDDGLAESVAPVLETSASGQVLLSMALADTLRNLPGLSLQPYATGGWRSLQWRPDEPRSLAVDEQAVLGMIRTLGREDPLAASTEPAAPRSAAPTGTFQPPATLGRSFDQPEPSSVPLWKKPWLVVSAGGLVLVLVAALVIRVMIPGAAPQPAPDTTKTSVPAASPNAAPGAGPAAVEKPAAAKPGKPGRQPKTEPKVEAKSEPPAVAKPAPSSCGLTETEIPLSLQRAGRLMSAGKLPEAQDAYQRLLGCPSAHEQAAEGLRQVKQRMGFQR